MKGVYLGVVLGLASPIVPLRFCFVSIVFRFARVCNERGQKDRSHRWECYLAVSGGILAFLRRVVRESLRATLRRVGIRSVILFRHDFPDRIEVARAFFRHALSWHFAIVAGVRTMFVIVPHICSTRVRVVEVQRRRRAIVSGIVVSSRAG